MAECPRGTRSQMAPPLPFVPDVHLACWQGNLPKLKALMRANNCVLTSLDVECCLFLPFGLPNCLRADGSPCPRAQELEREEATAAALTQTKVPRTTLALLNCSPPLASSQSAAAAAAAGAQTTQRTGGCHPQLSSLSGSTRVGRVSPYSKRVKDALSTASEEMEALMRRHGHCPKVWGNPAQLALTSGSVRCANFVLAVLLIRKLLRTRVIGLDDPLVTEVWNQNPRTSILDAVDRITKDLALVAPATKECLHPALNRSESKCAVIAASALGQAATVRALRFRKNEDASILTNSCRPLVVTTLLGGDPATVREMLQWLVPSMTGEELVAACCQTLELALLYEDTDLASLVTVLGEFYPLKFNTPIEAFLEGLYGLLNHFIWIKEKQSEPEDAQEFSWDPLKSEDIIITYAPFFLNPPDMTAPGWKGIAYVEPKYVHALVDRREWSILPGKLKQYFHRIFATFCQKERAGWVLLQMENEQLLRSIPTEALQRVLLTLTQHICVTAERYHFKRKCDLCSRPILSFVLWSADKPEVVSSATHEEVSWYCSPSDLHYCSTKLATLRHGPLCAYHRFGVLSRLTSIPHVVAAVREQRLRSPLSLHAVLAVLRNLHGESDRLRVSELPTQLQRYFFLESATEAEEADGKSD